MGFSGSFLLCRVSDLEEIDWAEGEPFDSDLIASDAGEWLVAQYDDEDLFWTRSESLARLVVQTRHPALVGLCLDSDFLAVVGLSPDGVFWDGVVYPDVADDYREEGLQEGYEEVLPEFMEPARAVAGAVAWAKAAGLGADRAALNQIFTVREWEQPADQFWGDLLDALGFGSD